MKKSIILLCILLLTGCNKTVTLDITSSNITNIIYEDIELMNNDFEIVLTEINNKKYYELYDNTITGDKLIIKTKEQNYNFEIVNKYIIYIVDNNRYFTSTNNINKKLKTIVNKYNDDSFITINYYNNYDINKADYLINIDNSNKYIVINTSLNIYNLKISKYQDKTNIANFNNIDNIESNKKICIQTNNPELIHISFNTPYNYKIKIYYDGKFNKVLFKN